MMESSWIEAMQEEIHEFERLEVWELVPRPSNVMLINLKWILKVKLDEYGRKRAFEQETWDLDVEIKQMKVFKASYSVTAPQELHWELGSQNQYLTLTQGNQAPGMVKSEVGEMKEKDIEDMIIAEYMKYEAKMKRQS
ncbi:hypothetical protein Tco_1124585 [Tanacetum coccineum]|uniref:Uncharacterized protein n=1 Tax=Tanacetum coccineum TaxID=301880 RepID=A0ABQ5J809_9ASTR